MMKITKYVHSCLLVEMPAPVNRTVLFDPGGFSEKALDIDSLEFLDNIVISHNHPDHMSVELVKKLVAKFPEVRITTTRQAADDLKSEGITAVIEETPGITFFESPHADGAPLFTQHTEEIGVNYLELLSFPGDSHDFNSTMPILALPVIAPWGSTRRAAELAIELGPKYVVPIHDWNYSEEARSGLYEQLGKLFAEHDITFIKPVTGQPFVIDHSSL